MELNVLGTGSSGNCYVASIGKDIVLLDAGFSIDYIGRRVNLNKVKLAFISHAHRDHDAFSKGQPNSVNLPMRRIPTVRGSIIRDFIKIKNNRKFESITNVYAFPVDHGDEPNAGVIIQTEDECILYITDFNLCKWNLSQFKFTSVIVECNYVEKIIQPLLGHAKYDRQINSHMGLNGTIKFLEHLDKSELKEIYLCHISQTVGDEVFMGSEVYQRYNIPVGVCKKNGGVNWYGRCEVDQDSN